MENSRRQVVEGFVDDTWWAYCKFLAGAPGHFGAVSDPHAAPVSLHKALTPRLGHDILGHDHCITYFGS